MDNKFESMNEDAPGQSDQATGESSWTTDQSPGATDKANETVKDDKLESMSDDVNEIEPGCEIPLAESDEKESCLL